jgi:putative CocE/NonD family hydrolase
MEVTGPVEARLWAASTARDTDFTAKLVDVQPDGTALNLCDGILRARYRGGFETPAPLDPGQPVELSIDLSGTCNVFLPGHRIRLEVSSSNFPRFDRNTNTGENIATDRAHLVATNTVLHDASHPSRVILPVVARS